MNYSSALVTNDDGIESPLLLPFIAALSETQLFEDLRVVVPSEERSWISQGFTRTSAVKTSKETFSTHHGFTCSGTPADCTSLGIYNLFPNKPDFVFSGINIGTNAGIAYFLSSGTVGAASLAMLSGVKAAAFSLATPAELFTAWQDRNFKKLAGYRADWQRVSNVAAAVTKRLIATNAWQHASFYSININWEATPETPCVLSELGDTQFQRLFHTDSDNSYYHKQEALFIIDKDAHAKKPPLAFFGNYQPHSPTERLWQTHNELPKDIDVIEDGKISVTPVTYRFSAELSPAAQKQLETNLNSEKADR